MERECRASDRLDTRREAEVTVVWGRGTADGEAKAARCAGHTSSREHACGFCSYDCCCVSSNSCCSCLELLSGAVHGSCTNKGGLVFILPLINISSISGG